MWHLVAKQCIKLSIHFFSLKLLEWVLLFIVQQLHPGLIANGNIHRIKILAEFFIQTHQNFVIFQAQMEGKNTKSLVKKLLTWKHMGLSHRQIKHFWVRIQIQGNRTTIYDSTIKSKVFHCDIKRIFLAAGHSLQ